MQNLLETKQLLYSGAGFSPRTLVLPVPRLFHLHSVLTAGATESLGSGCLSGITVVPQKTVKFSQMQWEYTST